MAAPESNTGGLFWIVMSVVSETLSPRLSVAVAMHRIVSFGLEFVGVNNSEGLFPVESHYQIAIDSLP